MCTLFAACNRGKIMTVVVDVEADGQIPVT